MSDNSTDFVRWVVWRRAPGDPWTSSDAATKPFAIAMARSWRERGYEVRGPTEVRVPMPEEKR